MVYKLIPKGLEVLTKFVKCGKWVGRIYRGGTRDIL